MITLCKLFVDNHYSYNKEVTTLFVVYMLLTLHLIVEAGGPSDNHGRHLLKICMMAKKSHNAFMFLREIFSNI